MSPQAFGYRKWQVPEQSHYYIAISIHLNGFAVNLLHNNLHIYDGKKISIRDKILVVFGLLFHNKEER